MRRILVILSTILFLFPLFYSSEIKVSVPELLNGEVSGFFLNATSKFGLVKSKLEFSNVGSIPFRCRGRMEILHQGNVIQTIWSDERILNPSERSVYNFFSYINNTGEFNLRFRFYYGGEILEYGNISFEVADKKETKDTFKVRRVRKSGDFLKFDVKSEEEVNKIIILFSGYPKSWIIEQEALGNLEINNWEPVNLKYYPTPWPENEILLHVFTEEGNFHKRTQVSLEEVNDIGRFLHNLLDILLRLF
ncbi:MAG: hypothetical protein GF368_03905 [Candidatus Aenigmarchaeota archaeon]|nr:hypothetical protein [Candidatus Aenigmarchaeota archaeon]